MKPAPLRITGASVRAAATIAAIAATAAALSACGWLRSSDDEQDKPAELVDFKPTMKVREIWHAGVGDGNEVLRLALAPASDGTRIYAADNDGSVAAFDAARGRRLWRTDTRLPLAGGPGVGEGHVVTGSSDGFVVSLRADNGKQEWRANVASEVLAAPAVGPRQVYVRTVDGKLIALSLTDGAQSWFVQQTMPRLSVRGTGSPVVDGDQVICGFDNGRVAAYDANDGSVLWDVLVEPPTGRTEVERLSDLNATVRVIGDDAYAVGYQGRLVALGRESGQILWSVEFSSYSGLGADLNNLYVSGDTGELLAVERRTGRELWRREDLGHRDLTAPTPYAGSVVVGDLEGYLHFFDGATGTPQARVRPDSARITAAPLVVNETLYVLTDGGELAAYRDVTTRGK
jgi:outer membrane protein assembly factor BamB